MVLLICSVHQTFENFKIEPLIRYRWCGRLMLIRFLEICTFSSTFSTDTLNIYAKRYPSDSGERWRQMDPLWGRLGSPMSNLPIRILYLQVHYSVWIMSCLMYIPSYCLKMDRSHRESHVSQVSFTLEESKP